MAKTTPMDDNLSDAAALLGAGDDETVPPLPKAKAAAKNAENAPKSERRIRIMLEDNEEIPPGGQFIAVNGRSFLLQPGHVVDAPEGLVDVLDHAVKSIPIVDEMKSVIGYKDRLRFPYRVINSDRG